MYLDAVNLPTESEAVESAVVGRERTEAFSRWKNWPPSMISHHAEQCCETAREWLLAMDFSELNGAAVSSGPRWLRSRYKWGASSFPIFWCEAAERKTLDCGALAAFAHQIFIARGVRSFRVQIVQRFSRDSARQWNQSWSETGEPLKWIDGELIYHEGCAIPSPRPRDCRETQSHVFEMRGHPHPNGNGDRPHDLSATGKVIDFDTHRPAPVGHRNVDAGKGNGHPTARPLEGVPVKIWDATAGWWCDPCLTDGYGSTAAVRINADPGSRPLRWGRHSIRPNEWTELK